MRHDVSRFAGFENTEIFYQFWRPVTESSAVLVIVHGYAEHSGRYQHVAEYFVGRDYAVYALDHRGHGRSTGERAHVERFEDFVVDLQAFVNLIREQEPEAGMFVIGHSMGAVIATLFAAEHGELLQGLILSGAYVRARQGVPAPLLRVVRLLATVAPKLGLIPLEASTVSRDPAVVARYDSDPLNYRGRVRARMGVEMLRAGETALENAHKITLPVLIMHGGDDKLADPEGSRLIYQRVSSTDKTLKIYDGLYHEIFNEPEQEQVLADVAGWLAERT